MNRCKECKELLFEKNISSKKDFLKRALKNHTDKGDNESIFADVSSCNDEYFGIDPLCVKETTNDEEDPKFNHSPKYEDVPRYGDKDIKYENFYSGIKNILKYISNKNIVISDDSLKYLNLILNKLLFYIIENTEEGIKRSIKKNFPYDLALHAIASCGKSKNITKLILSTDNVKNILLKYYLENISEKQLKILTCLLEYICSEILELSLKYIKGDKIDIDNIKECIKNDKDNLNILINLVLNVPNPIYYSKPKKNQKRKASPKKVRKSCNPDQIRNPDTGRCVLRRSPLGKKILKMGGSRRASPRRASPRRASPRRASPRRASPRRKNQKKLKRCDSDKIRNPKTRRCVLKKSPLGKKLLEKKTGRRASPKRRLSPKKIPKPCNPDQIRNPDTRRCILRRTELGKKILAEMKKSKSL